MKPQLQRIEFEPAVSCDHYFSIEHALVSQLCSKRVEQLRKVAIQRFCVAALNEDLIAIAKDKGAEPIPLRFEDPISVDWQFANALGEHRQDGRVHGKIHASILYRRCERRRPRPPQSRHIDRCSLRKRGFLHLYRNARRRTRAFEACKLFSLREAMKANQFSSLLVLGWWGVCSPDAI